MKQNNRNLLFCPVSEVQEKLPFPYAEIAPLLQHLIENNQLNAIETFGRGTITDTGKLDCCKQELGATGAALLSEALQKNTQIKSILLGTGGIGNDGAKSVAQLLEKNESIRTVYLGCNYIESEGVKALTDGLIDNKTVRALWLKRNPIKEKGAIHLANLLKKNRRIRTLDLVNTHIGYRGLKALIETFLESNYPIERFYIGGNNFGQKEAELIALLLKNSGHLKELLLSVNAISNQGAAFIGKSLEKNQQLTNLSLSSNNIGDKGFIELFECLKNNETLEYLDLGIAPSAKVLGAKENEIGNLSAKAIMEYLGNNTALKYLDIQGNKLDYYSLKDIKNALKENKSLQKLILGKGHSRILKREIKAILNKNIDTKPSSIPEDILDIISVYR